MSDAYAVGEPINFVQIEGLLWTICRPIKMAAYYQRGYDKTYTHLPFFCMTGCVWNKANCLLRMPCKTDVTKVI